MSELRLRPAPVTHTEALIILDDFRQGFATGDTLEGSLSIFLGDPTPDGEEYLMEARYRVGNLTGQGGIHIVGEWEEIDGD